MEAVSQLFANGSVLFAVLLIAAMAGLYSERSGVGILRLMEWWLLGL